MLRIPHNESGSQTTLTQEIIFMLIGFRLGLSIVRPRTDSTPLEWDPEGIRNYIFKKKLRGGSVEGLSESTA